MSSRSKCPQCGSHGIAAILRGDPIWDAELERRIDAKEVVLGGCVFTGDDPEYHCNACGHEWVSHLAHYRRISPSPTLPVAVNSALPMSSES